MSGRLPRGVAFGDATRLPIGWSREADPGEVADLRQDLSALPDQEVARPDPLYRLIALS